MIAETAAIVVSILGPGLLEEAKKSIASTKMGQLYDQWKNPEQISEKAQQILRQSLAEIEDDLAEWEDAGQWEALLVVSENRQQFIGWIMDPCEEIDPTLNEWALDSLPNSGKLRQLLLRLHGIIQKKKRRHLTLEYQNLHCDHSRIEDKVDSLQTSMDSLAADRLDQAAPAKGRHGQEIDDISELVTHGKLDVAEDRLKQITRDSWDLLTAREKYRVHALHGHVYRRRGAYAEASQFFFKAHQQIPETEIGRWAEVFSARLLGEFARTQQLATVFRNEFPDSILALKEWLRSSGPEMEFEDILRAIAEPHTDNDEVRIVLADLAMQKELWPLAEEYARNAMVSSPEWIAPKLFLGYALIQTHEAQWSLKAAASHTSESIERLAEAIGLLEDVLQTGAHTLTPVEQEQARNSLSVAYRFTGAQDKAADVLQEGLVIFPESSVFRSGLAGHWIDTGQPAKAIDMLEPLQDRTSQDAFLLASAYNKRSAVDDWTKAIELLKLPNDTAEAKLAGYPRQSQTQWIRLLLHCCIASKDFIGFNESLAGPMGQWLSSVDVLVFKALLAGTNDRLEEANGFVDQVLQDPDLPNQLDASLRERLARALFNLDRYSESLPYWQELASSHYIDPFSEAMIDCAHKADRQDVVLEFCQELREHGIWDRRYLSTELSILQEISPNKQLDLLIDATNPDMEQDMKREFQTWRTYVAMALNRPEYVDANPDHLPAVEDVDNIQLGRITVEILRRSEKSLNAIEYAYQLFRRFPDEIDAHQAMMYSLFFGNAELLRPNAVEIGSAVRYQKDESSEEVWAILESASPLRPSLSEISPDSEIAQGMMGKAKGDQFVWRGMPRSTATILDVTNKYIFRGRQCANEMEDRFPGSSAIRKIHMPNQENGKIDIRGFLHQIEEITSGTTELESLYAEGRAPLPLVGIYSNGSAFTAAMIVADRADLALRCWEGNIQECQSAIGHLASAEEIVLDATALGTLHNLQYRINLDIEALFESIPLKCIISEHTRRDLDVTLRTIRDGGGLGVTVSKGHAELSETSAEAQEQSLELLADLIQAVDKHVDVHNGTTLAAANPFGRIKNSKIEGLIGLSGLHSLLLAGDAGRILWTDDLFSAQLASLRATPGRIWTQLLLNRLSETERISRVVECASTVALVAMGYQFTFLCPHHLIWAGQQTNWDTEAHELRTISHYLNNVSAIPDSQAFVVGAVLRYLWREEGLVIRREQLTYWFLDALATAPNGGMIIEKIRQLSFGMFGPIDIITPRKLQDCIESWDSGAGRIIVP